MATTCRHLTELQKRKHRIEPTGPGCEECLASGGEWVHLRLCMSCGHVGCCDDSPSRHATAHFHRTRHPVIKSFEPDEDWAWCYEDGTGVPAIPTYPEESPQQHFSSPVEAP